MKPKYVIFGGVDTYDNQPMFWNNSHGWVSLQSATKFTEQETKNFERLPVYDKTHTPVWVRVV